MTFDDQTPERAHSSFRSIWRMSVWAVCAAFGLAITFWASTSPPGVDRLNTAMNAWAGKSAAPTATAQLGQTPAARSFDAENETKRLAQLVQLLAADRDRLASRVSSIERNVDDITGSVRRNTERVERAESAAQPMPQAPAPVISAPATVTTSTAATSSAPPPPANDNAPAPSPQPPTRAAALAPTPEAKPPAASVEHAVDLGGAVTVDGLKLLWQQAQRNHPTLLDGAQPSVALRAGLKTGTPQLRLVAGPIADAATAARICAGFTPGKGSCRPTTIDGPTLPLK